MNILILGCSFGVPGAGCPSEDHTETQLRKLGYNIINFARSGSSNLNSLNIACSFLKQVPIKVDWIVWFHTELVRDIGDLEEYKKNKNLELSSFQSLAEIVYTSYAEFVSMLQTKIAIIGGAAPVHPELYNHIKPDFCIPSWFNEILKLDLPQIQTLSRLDIIEKMQSIGNLTKLEILQQHEEILNALEASEDFPDNYHPGSNPHLELSKNLHQLFQETK